MTFGVAYGLNRTADFVDAFSIARRLVSRWEIVEDFQASEPQIDEGALIGEKLAAWRAGVQPGPALPFTPPAE